MLEWALLLAGMMGCCYGAYLRLRMENRITDARWRRLQEEYQQQQTELLNQEPSRQGPMVQVWEGDAVTKMTVGDYFHRPPRAVSPVESLERLLEQPDPPALMSTEDALKAAWQELNRMAPEGEIPVVPRFKIDAVLAAVLFPTLVALLIAGLVALFT